MKFNSISLYFFLYKAVIDNANASIIIAMYLIRSESFLLLSLENIFHEEIQFIKNFVNKKGFE